MNTSTPTKRPIPKVNIQISAVLNRICPLVEPEQFTSKALLVHMLDWSHQMALFDGENPELYWKQDKLLSELDELKKNKLSKTSLKKGWLYVYCNGYLFSEYEVKEAEAAKEQKEDSPKKLPTLHPVDLLNQQGQHQRTADEEAHYFIELPHSSDEECHYEIAYSEFQWSWMLINHYGGISEDAFFDAVFPHCPFINKSIAPSICLAKGDINLINFDAIEARKKRFNSLELSTQANNPHIAMSECGGSAQSSIKVAGLIPEAWKEEHPELSEQPNFISPVSEFIDCSLIQSYQLAGTLVNNFTNVSAALTGLKTILAGTLEEKQHFGELFEYPEYYETALLLTQLFYAKRNEDSGSLDLNAPLTGRSLTSAWQKDANAIAITDKLSFDDIQRTLKTAERAVMRNLLIYTQMQLATLFSSQHQDDFKLYDTQDNLINLQTLNTQFIEYLNDFRAIGPSDIPEEPEDESIDKPEHNLGIATRWSRINTLLEPFAINAKTFVLLHNFEAQYEDTKVADFENTPADGPEALKHINQMQAANLDNTNIDKFAAYPKEILQAIFDGKHPVASMLLPDKLSPIYAYEESIVTIAASIEVNLDNADNIEAGDNVAQLRKDQNHMIEGYLSAFEDYLKNAEQKKEAEAEKSDVASSTNGKVAKYLKNLSKVVNEFGAKFSPLVKEMAKQAVASNHQVTTPTLIKLVNTLTRQHIDLKTISALSNISLEESDLSNKQNGNRYMMAKEILGNKRSNRYILSSTDPEYNKNRITYPNSKKAKVLTVAHTKAYQVSQKQHVLAILGNDAILEFMDEQKQLDANSRAVQGAVNDIKQAHIRSATLHTQFAAFMVLLDMFSLAVSYEKLKHNTDDKQQLILGVKFVSAFINLPGSMHSLVNKMYQLNAINGIANEASATQKSMQKLASKIVGSDTKWKISRYSVGSKYLPVIGNVMAVGADGMLFIDAWERGDDSVIAHFGGMVGSAMAISAIYYSTYALILGPIGVAVSLASYFLLCNVFTEEKVFDAWLRVGPFSRGNLGTMTPFQLPSSAHWQPNNKLTFFPENTQPLEKVANCQIGLPSTLMETQQVGSQRIEAPMALIGLDIPNRKSRIILDQNYRLLGVSDYVGHLRGSYALGHDGSEAPLVVKYNKLFLVGDKNEVELGELGQTLGSTAQQVRQKMLQYYTQAFSDAIAVDREGRGATGLAGDIWLDAFVKYPEANTEALLNGLFPIKVSATRYPVGGQWREKESFDFDEYGGKTAKTISVYDGKLGDNVAISIDLPYFIEQRSTLIIELREKRPMFGNRYEQQVVPFTDEGDYRLEIDSIDDLPTYNQATADIINKQHKHQVYKTVNDNDCRQIVIIANYLKHSIYGYEDAPYNKEANLEAWVRLSVNGTTETQVETVFDETKVEIDDSLSEKEKQEAIETARTRFIPHKAVWLPFRSKQGWKDSGVGYVDGKILKGVITHRSDGKVNAKIYASDDHDWVYADASDLARS